MNVAFSPGITESRTIQITCPRSILRPESVPASLTLNHLRLCENICFILVFSSGPVLLAVLISRIRSCSSFPLSTPALESGFCGFGGHPVQTVGLLWFACAAVSDTQRTPWRWFRLHPPAWEGSGSYHWPPVPGWSFPMFRPISWQLISERPIL
jgi:hypothetical protein